MFIDVFFAVAKNWNQPNWANIHFMRYYAVVENGESNWVCGVSVCPTQVRGGVSCLLGGLRSSVSVQ